MADIQEPAQNPSGQTRPDRPWPMDALKLALPGCRHSVEWWGLPTRLEWALAPDRGAGGPQTRSLAARMAFGRLRGPWAQELKSP